MLARMLGGLAASTLLLSCGLAQAQSAPAISAERLSEHIRVLADDRMEGRFPGRVGEELTLNYLQSQYEAMGLEPGGPDGAWRQPVELVRLTPARAPAASWVDRQGVVHPMTSSFILRAGVSADHLKLDNIPIVFGGYGVVAPERNWDDYGDIDLTGKVVILLDGQPTAFGDYPNYYGSAQYKTREALKRGAVGVLTLYALHGPQGVPDGRRARMTIAGSVETSFSGALNLDIADPMAVSLGGDMATVIADAQAGGDFRAHDLGLKLNVDIAETPEVIASNNLLARIPGTTHPDEYVVYSAHWDHVGVAADPNAAGDRIYNGAWDNASGTSGLLEVARAFKAAPPPERTVVFLHVTAEEQGLLGSEWYTAHPVYPLEKTVADINIDMLPFTPATRTIAIFGPGKSTLEDDLARLAARQGRTVVGEGEPAQGFYYRSDHFNFAIGGVPAIMPWTGVDFVEGGAAVGRPFYLGQMRDYYHGLEDEWRPDYDFTAALQNLEILYELGDELADSREWPQWKPDAEFAATRALSDAARR